MIVEELIGRLSLQTKGIGEAKKATKELENFRKALKALAGETRKTMAPAAGGLGKFVTTFDRSSDRAKVLRGEVDKMTASVRRLAGVRVEAARSEARAIRIVTRAKAESVRTVGSSRAEVTAARREATARDRSARAAARAAARASSGSSGRSGSGRSASSANDIVGNIGSGVVGAVGRVAAPLAVAAFARKSIVDFAAAERAITRIGITAEATDSEIKDLGKSLYDIAQKNATPYTDVVETLDTLVSQGRSLKDAMSLMPSVVKTASATNADPTDIAKTADAVATHLKISADEMQQAFDEMATAGKIGQFELKDMARYLPSMAAQAKAVGFAGKEGLADLTAMMQVIRKGSGTSEEAADSMINILQKMESETTKKKLDAVLGEGATEKAFKEARKNGENLVVTFEKLLKLATKGDVSLVPKFIQDLQFGRGAAALLSQPGQWEQWSAQIKKALNTVDEDQTRVLNNTQAQLDRATNRWNAFVRDVGLGAARITNYIAESRAGKATDAAVDATASGIRSLFENKPTPTVPLLGVSEIDAKVADLRSQAEAKRRAGAGRPSFPTGLLRNATGPTKSVYERQADDLEARANAVDQLRKSYADMRGELDRIRGSQSAAFNRQYGPQAINPVGAFGLHGAAAMDDTPRFGAPAAPLPPAPMGAHPLPPARPGGRGIQARTFGDLSEVLGGANRVQDALQTIETKAQSAGETMRQSLQVEGKITMDDSALDRTLGKINQIRAAAGSIGGVGGASITKGSNTFTSPGATAP